MASNSFKVAKATIPQHCLQQSNTEINQHKRTQQSPAEINPSLETQNELVT